MNTKPAKIGILLLVLLSISVVLGLRKWYQQNKDCQNGKTPIKNYLVTIDVNQEDRLIEQSREFASAHGFRFDVVYYTPTHDEFLVDLTRRDVEIIITNSFTPGEFEISLYNNNCIRPTQVSDIGGLVQDLYATINKIPDAIITEEK
jgi:hypothetical protein